MFAKRAYLLDVTGRMPKMRTLTEWVDFLARYRYNALYLYSESQTFDGDVDFGRLAAYGQMQGVDVERLGHDGWNSLVASGDVAFVSTESSRSLVGRVEEMRERMEKAEASARDRRAGTFVVTDFTDECRWQPLVVSVPGLILGGNFAAVGKAAAKMDLERELNGTLGVPLGGVLLKLGTLYLRGGALRADRSEFFSILSGDHGYSRHPGITQTILDDVSGIAHAARITAERWSDRSDWAREIAYAALLLDCACHRRDEARLRTVRDEHGQIWRMRFFEEGRVESLARLPRF